MSDYEVSGEHWRYRQDLRAANPGVQLPPPSSDGFVPAAERPTPTPTQNALLEEGIPLLVRRTPRAVCVEWELVLGHDVIANFFSYDPPMSTRSAVRRLIARAASDEPVR